MLLDVRSRPAVSVTHVSQAVDAVTVARLIVDASPVVYASAPQANVNALVAPPLLHAAHRSKSLR